MFFSVILTANYTASLTSFLTIPVEAVTEVKDLSDLEFKPFAVLQSTSAMSYFLLPEHSMYLKNMVVKATWDDALQALNNEEIAAIVRDKPLLDYEKNNIPCNKFLVGSEFDKGNYAFGFKKNTTINDPELMTAFNTAILSLKESGVIEDLYSSWWNDGYCAEEESNDPQSLNIVDFMGVFALVGIVSAIGIVVLVIEVVFYQVYKNVKSPNIILRSIDTFFGGINMESRELKEEFMENENGQQDQEQELDESRR